MKQFTYVPVLSGGYPLPEVTVTTETDKQANAAVWATLTDAQKDNCEYLDCVDVREVGAA